MNKIKIFKNCYFFYLFAFLCVLSVSFFSMGFYKIDLAQDISQDVSEKDYQGPEERRYNSVEEIDKRIKELEEMKRGYEAKSIKQANQAQRLQFIQGELQTAKRYWKLSEDNKKIAVRIQKEIDELKIKKMQLQNKKG